MLPVLSPQRSPDTPSLLPRLRSFRLRQEGVDAPFQESLAAFLLATKNFVHLHVLLEGSGPFLSPDCFVHNHGSTLWTLVWDQRQKSRKGIDEYTHTATQPMMYSALESICANCRNLQELGVAMNAFGEDTTWPVRFIPPCAQRNRANRF